MMQIGLQDYATKPLKGIQKTVTQTADVSRQSWEQMAGGAASMLGSGFAIKQALMPAIEMDRVLGEVKSLGVIDADLKTLQQTALDFSSTYGKSATQMVGAAYDIKSAMGDMSGADLAGVTESSAILAAATKADTATITSYMGTMYSVFQSQADAIGKDNWAERLAGMTAKSVEKFKTTGQGMSDAFKGIGSLAKTHGIEMQNQMAILGMLQGSMSGSEAGTKYKAFLTGAVNAQEKLGLSFTDTNGKLLPMYDILESIKGKFGDLDSTEISQLKSAFGSDEAIMVVTDLIGKTQSLKANITDLGGAANLDFAKNMAGAMTDQWERLEASWYAIRAGAFGLILPAINSVAGAMADGLTTLLAYTQQYPTLTSYAGYYSILPVGVSGITYVMNQADWITTYGSDIEGDDDLALRIRNQFSVVGRYHIDAIYRSMLASVAGIRSDQIYFEHNAPRGPGTANAYILMDVGLTPSHLIEQLNNHVMGQGNHGHGDDLLVLSVPDTQHRVVVTIEAKANVSADNKALLKTNVENMVRAAFRESDSYAKVTRAYPVSTFSFSLLTTEIHNELGKDLLSIQFDNDDIESLLVMPRLSELVVQYG
ncbi:TPA: phage tail tape measure protein [Vibrio parahaemolyticus]|nr:phage tail tape measure protein [Vibrio parahaemolyticus]